MRKLISSLVLTGALIYGSNALAQEYKEDWKMLVPTGNLIATGNCDEREDSPKYFVYDAYSSGGRRDVWISLDRIGIFAKYRNGFDRVYVDNNGDGTAEFSVSAESLKLFCKNLNLISST